MNTKDNKIISSLLWKFAERMGAQGVSFVVSVVLARILTPDDFSVVGIVAIFFAFCNVLVSGGFSTALIQKKDADRLDYSSVFFVSLAISVLLYWVMFIMAPVIASIYEQTILIPVVRVMSGTLVINAVKGVICAYVSSQMEFKKFFWATLSGTVVSAFVGIGLALSGAGPWALVAQQMTNSFIDTVVLWVTTRFRVDFRVSIQRVKKLFSYGSKMLMASIISVAYNEAYPLIIGLKFTGADLSFYTKGQSFPSLLNAATTNTISAVLFPAMAKVQDDKEEVLNMTRRYIAMSSYILFPAMFGLMAVSENFVVTLLGEKWAPAAVYVKILSIAYAFDLVQIGNLQVIKSLGKSGLYLRMEIIKKILYTIVIISTLLWTNSPVILACASMVNTVIATLVNTAPNRKLIGYRYSLQIMDIAPNLLISIIMCIVVIQVGRFEMACFVELMLQILIGVLVYLGLSIVARNPNYRMILDTIRKRG